MKVLEIADLFSSTCFTPRTPFLFAINTQLTHRGLDTQGFLDDIHVFDQKQDGSRLQLLGINQGEDPAEGVMRRNPVFQLQKFFQPLMLGMAEPLDLIPPGSIAEHRQKGDHQDLLERVFDHRIHPDILDFPKQSNEPLHGLSGRGILVNGYSRGFDDFSILKYWSANSAHG